MRQNPWEHPEIEKLPWRTESSFYGWLRGVLRQGWSTNPLKLEFKKSVRFKIPNPNPRGRVATVWGCKCSFCKKDFVEAEIEIDHKEGNNTLKCREDIQLFVERLFLFDFEDLQPVCKTCHRAKSYSDKQGISLDDALLEKTVIALCKKLSTEEQKAWIIQKADEKGITTKDIKNAKQRRDAIRILLENK